MVQALAKNPNVYFPYASLGQTQAAFQSANRIEICIPGISSSRPDILAKLESYQHYTHPDNRWLPQFMDLNNENKHERLTPQTREEARHLRLASGGASISLGPGSSISMGSRDLHQDGRDDYLGRSANQRRPPSSILWTRKSNGNSMGVIQLRKQRVNRCSLFWKMQLTRRDRSSLSWRTCEPYY